MFIRLIIILNKIKKNLISQNRRNKKSKSQN